MKASDGEWTGSCQRLHSVTIVVVRRPRSAAGRQADDVVGQGRVSLIAVLYLVAATAPRVAAFLPPPIYVFVLPPDSWRRTASRSRWRSVWHRQRSRHPRRSLLTYWEQPEADAPRLSQERAPLSRASRWRPCCRSVSCSPCSGSRCWLRPARGPRTPAAPAFAFLQRGTTWQGRSTVPKGVPLLRADPDCPSSSGGRRPVRLRAPLGQPRRPDRGSSRLPGLHRAGRASPFHGRTRAVRPAELLHVVRLVTKGAPLMPEQLARWAQMLSLRPLMSVFTSARETAQFTFSNAPAQSRRRSPRPTSSTSRRATTRARRRETPGRDQAA